MDDFDTGLHGELAKDLVLDQVLPVPGSDLDRKNKK
jgi:hypothetical protein